MKRRTIEHGAFPIMMLLTVSLVAFASPALAQTNVSIDDAIVYVDEVVTRSIMINNVTDPDGVGTANIKLSFDSNVVHVTASTAGDFEIITPNFEHNESGADSYVTFLASQPFSSGLTGDVLVTNVTLKAVGTAGQESPLNITIEMLADKTLQGNEIPADDVDGIFEIRAQTNVSIDDAIVYVDEVVTRSIMINNVTDPDGVGTANIKLSFDSNVVHVTASTAGDFEIITPNFEHNESGADSYVTFLAQKISFPGLTGDVLVTNVTLKAVGTAGQESPLNITIEMLADKTPQGNEIPADDVDGTFTIAVPVLTTITVSPTTANLTVGDTQLFTATAYDQYGAPMAGLVLTWTSTTPAVGTVNPTTATTGVGGTATTTFTAVGAGTTTVTATNGTVNGTAAVTVTLPPPVLTTITVSPTTANLTVGDTQLFTATAYDQYGAPMAGLVLTWTSTTPAVGTVNPTTATTGVGGTATTTFTAVGAGTTTVTATNGTVNGTAAVNVTRVCGDVDTHEGLDARDATYLTCHIAGISGYETLYGDGDVDPNEGLDARDATYLTGHIAGISGYETLHC